MTSTCFAAAGRPHSPGRLLLCCLLGVALLSGCATLRPDFETPTVTISSFRPVTSAGAVPSFEIGLRVINPNAEPLKLRGVAYTVALAGRQIVTGVGKDLPVIEGYGEGVFTVTAAANLYEGMRLFGDLLGTQQETIDYELTTKLDVGALLPAIRVKDKGAISLTPQ